MLKRKNSAKNGTIANFLRSLLKFIRFLKNPKKWRFPHLQHFVELPCIHVHFIALDSLGNSPGRKLEAARLSPRPRTTWAEYWSNTDEPTQRVV